MALFSAGLKIKGIIIAPSEYFYRGWSRERLGRLHGDYRVTRPANGRRNPGDSRVAVYSNLCLPGAEVRRNWIRKENALKQNKIKNEKEDNLPLVGLVLKLGPVQYARPAASCRHIPGWESIPSL